MRRNCAQICYLLQAVEQRLGDYSSTRLRSDFVKKVYKKAARVPRDQGCASQRPCLARVRWASYTHLLMTTHDLMTLARKISTYLVLISSLRRWLAIMMFYYMTIVGLHIGRHTTHSKRTIVAWPLSYTLSVIHALYTHTCIYTEIVRYRSQREVQWLAHSLWRYNNNSAFYTLAYLLLKYRRDSAVRGKWKHRSWTESHWTTTCQNGTTSERKPFVSELRLRTQTMFRVQPNEVNVRETVILSAVTRACVSMKKTWPNKHLTYSLNIRFTICLISLQAANAKEIWLSSDNGNFGDVKVNRKFV